MQAISEINTKKNYKKMTINVKWKHSQNEKSTNNMSEKLEYKNKEELLVGS